jgi:adenylylsulfate kinase-like enzyme
VKGLYAAARAGKIKNFTGISSPYEIPAHPDVTIDTTAHSIEENAELLLQKLKGYLP